MKIIQGARLSGRSTMLLEMANEKNGIVLAPTSAQAYFLKELAAANGLENVEICSYEKLQKMRGTVSKYNKSLFIDNLDSIIRSMFCWWEIEAIVIKSLEDVEVIKLANICGKSMIKEWSTPQPGQKWIPVTEGLPKEHDSIFAKFYGTDKWNKHMFRKTSDKVITTAQFEDGTCITEVSHTIDGKWENKIKSIPRKVVAWMPLPEPYKEELAQK